MGFDTVAQTETDDTAAQTKIDTAAHSSLRQNNKIIAEAITHKPIQYNK